MALPCETVSRADAERRSQDCGRRQAWKPYHWRFQWNGDSVRVKDVRNCSPLFRWTLGRLLIRHEARMYERLKGVDLAPRCYGMLDGDALLLEDVPAPSLGQVRKPRLDAALLDRLSDRVRSLHAMGIVHLDLRSRRNVLVTRDNETKLIDFANALYLGAGPLARRVLIPLLGAIDYSAVLKFRQRDFPDSLSPDQQAWYARFRRWRRLWPFGSNGRRAKRNGQLPASGGHETAALPAGSGTSLNSSAQPPPANATPCPRPGLIPEYPLLPQETS